ncbi:deoxyribose-phosphate aldolase-like [Artemia franciscana]|uniref:deoxyribose-phosphate aldolase-like n=1 Tax=Artemia franciscana TaxID=6661 RepID=UPI0032DBCA24
MKLNKYIDHTLLKPEATATDIEKLCLEAKQYEFASVCVNPTYVSLAYELLQDTNVNVCVVVGFPLGANITETKIMEITNALHDGASEIDMVMNISQFKSNNYDLVADEMRACKKAAGEAVVKVYHITTRILLTLFYQHNRKLANTPNFINTPSYSLSTLP